MQASAVKQKLEGASTFLSKLRWSKEMKNILINEIFLKPYFQWNCCTVGSFCDQLYTLDWIYQLVFSYWSKPHPQRSPMLMYYSSRCQSSVPISKLLAWAVPRHYMARGFWRINESHSFTVFPLEVIHASVTGMLEYTPCFPVMPTPSSQ